MVLFSLSLRKLTVTSNTKIPFFTNIVFYTISPSFTSISFLTALLVFRVNKTLLIKSKLSKFLKKNKWVYYILEHIKHNFIPKTNRQLIKNSTIIDLIYCIFVFLKSLYFCYKLMILYLKLI